MTKGRETTQTERIAVAKACIANGKNYGEVAIAYNVSYQQARSWTLKYIEAVKVLWKTGGASERRISSPGQNWSRHRLRLSNSSIS